ncbi:UDP-N-acetylmuramoyl-L-alanyl-D-glutamate--2,6-diaminopimelate ligase [Candidatus Avelusimicrobium aviculae]|uniref:UDP-N-acetylmuramoyl-L-alanyl-D-glutamate--2, 6-diaminopimelate ligase n=1 Tax=Candidatus Avelusimicrobium aviculae TaxID=3416206 RepID=UPI003D0AD46C
MSLSKVLGLAYLNNLPVADLTFDSKAVRPGAVFFALKGSRVDGNLFIEDAVSRGAVMVVSSQPAAKDYGVLYYQSDDIERDMADAACEFYQRPSDRLKIIGITGTKGKTSIAYLVESVLTHAGKKVSALGTVNYRINGKVQCTAPNTTPAALPLFKLMHKMVLKESEFLVMEVSSHALDQKRVRRIDFDTAVFTNLQRDHLDYHLTFENYFQAKRKLFENLTSLQNPKSGRCAVINADDEYGRRLIQEVQNRAQVLTYGLENSADFIAENIQESLDGTTFTVNGRLCKIHLLGRHNVYNALAAYAVCVRQGLDPETVIEGLAALPGVPGRMERVRGGQDFYVFVDFAYTDEALNRAFDTVEHFKKGRIITVFGCGGERDRTKRPLMGATACKRSDLVFITNDNPRREDPQQIFADILQGTKGYSNFVVEPDRAQAICRALDAAQKDDVVIIAGKGHEEQQIIGAEKKHFSDKETVLAYLGSKNRVS